MGFRLMYGTARVPLAVAQSQSQSRSRSQSRLRLRQPLPQREQPKMLRSLAKSPQPQPQPQRFRLPKKLVQQGLQQELLTKSGKISAGTALRPKLFPKVLKELQHIKSSSKENVAETFASTTSYAPWFPAVTPNRPRALSPLAGPAYFFPGRTKGEYPPGPPQRPSPAEPACPAGSRLTALAFSVPLVSPHDYFLRI